MPDYVYRGREAQPTVPARPATPASPAPARDPQAPRSGLVPVELIVVHEHNVRRDLGDLRELTESIRRHGVITPVVLERYGERFRIRAGHRRVAAATIAGVKRVPALIHGKALADTDWVVNSVQENHHRRDMSREERRDVIRRLRGDGLTWQEVATEFGASVSSVQSWARHGHPRKKPAMPRPPKENPNDFGGPQSVFGEWLHARLLAANDYTPRPRPTLTEEPSA